MVANLKSFQPDGIPRSLISDCKSTLANANQAIQNSNEVDNDIRSDGIINGNELPQLTGEILMGIINKKVKKFKAKSNPRVSLDGFNIPLVDRTGKDKLSRAQFGSSLKFVNRDNEVREMISDLSIKYHHFTSGHDFSKELLCLPGSPGIGKSTFIRKSLVTSVTRDEIWDTALNIAIKDVVKDTVESGSIFRYDLSNEMTSNEYNNPVVYLSCKLLYLYIKNIKENEAEKYLFDKLKLYDPCSVFAEVLALFQSHIFKHQKRTGIVVLNIDETNVIERSSDKRRFLDNIISQSFIYLAKNLNSKNSPYPFLYMTFSGTNTINLPTYLKSCSNNTPKEIHLPVLKLNHCLEVISDIYVRTFDENDRINRKITKLTKQLEYLVNMTNGIPRYLEALVFALGCQDIEGFHLNTFKENVTKSDLNHKIYLNLTSSFITDSYKDAYDRMIHYQSDLSLLLVCYSLFDIPVSRDMVFSNNVNISLSSFVDLGSIFLEPTAVERQYLIKIPLILLRSILQCSSNLNNLCPKILFTDEPLSSTDNELDDLKIFQLKCITARYVKNQIDSNYPVKFSDICDFLDIFPNFNENYKDLEIQNVLRHIILSKEKLLTADVYEKYGKIIGQLILNAEHASAPDCFAVFLHFLIAFQSKRKQYARDDNNKSSPLNYATVKTEHNKFQPKNKGTHLFIFITDDKFEDFHLLKDNEIVIGKSLLERWMGKQLSYMRAMDYYFKPEKPLEVNSSTQISTHPTQVHTPSQRTTSKKRKYDRIN